MTVTETEAEGSSVTNYRAFDIDQHFFEPLTMWNEYTPKKYHHLTPRYAVDSLGLTRQIIGGRTFPRNPMVPIPRLNPALPTHVDHSKGGFGSDEVKMAGWDPQTRLRLLDAENVGAAVIYPTLGLHFGGIEDVELYTVLCQAYNNWASDYCKVAPDRLLAPALVPQLDVDATLVEAERAITQLGMPGVMLRPNPIGRTIEDPAWEPLWDMLNQLKVPVAFHESTSLCIPQFGTDRTENYIFQHMMSHPYEHMAAMMSLIGGGVFDRHPDLRAIFVEAGCGWAPYWMERMDHHFSSPYQSMQLSMAPSEIFKKHCFVAAEAEERNVLPGFEHSLGFDNICWSSDFPHPDHEWGGLVNSFTSRPELSVEAKRKVIGENAYRAYRMTPV